MKLRISLIPGCGTSCTGASIRVTEAQQDKQDFEKATSGVRVETDWERIIQICDLIRQGDVQPKYAVGAVKKQLYSANPRSALLGLVDTFNIMKREGYNFPTLRESDAMFSADTAPAWVDGDVCHRCRIQFGMVQRKHHCRACGQVFCGQCSSKTAALPKFGIEKEVRVCERCFDIINRPATTKPNPENSDLPPECSVLSQQSQVSTI
ncbi:Lateral signaling target protein 2 homolog [Gryllus bimaculatus]|nr:Lateral signaling target protein 2 homolog [Gryllus bimaculatus]